MKCESLFTTQGAWLQINCYLDRKMYNEVKKYEAQDTRRKLSIADWELHKAIGEMVEKKVMLSNIIDYIQFLIAY